MTIALVIALVAIAALAAWERTQQARAFDTERAQWRDERSELITRALHPQLVPRSKRTGPRPTVEARRISQVHLAGRATPLPSDSADAGGEE